MLLIIFIFAKQVVVQPSFPILLLIVMMLQFELFFTLNWLASLLLVEDALKLFRWGEVIQTAFVITRLVMVFFTGSSFVMEVAVGHSFPDSVG